MTRPATSPRFRRRASLGGLLLIAGLLGGCAEGDFGRIRSSLVTDDIHGWIGEDATPKPSIYGFTDDERELRDLAYPLIEAPFDRQRWYSILGEYGLNGIREQPFDRTAYMRVLMTRPARSATMRYQLFMEDVRNDLVRVGPFFLVAARVADMDAKREKSLAYIPELSKAELKNALARVAENRVAIQWVQISLRQRVEAYQFALERLVIGYPSPMAVECEQLLSRLRMLVDNATLVADNRPPRGHVSK